MRDIFRHFLLLKLTLLTVAAMTLYSCEADIEENEDDMDDIVSYLTKSHNPLLISSTDISTSDVIDPPFYTRYGDYAFLYIDDFYNAERESRTLVTGNSTISIYFRLYPFDGGNISDTELPSYTNDPTYIDLYEEEGLNLTYWDFTPLEINLSSSDIFETIHTALIGCREGDNIEIYMTRNMGYGNDVIGTIDQWSSLAFFCSIESVK